MQVFVSCFHLTDVHFAIIFFFFARKMPLQSVLRVLNGQMLNNSVANCDGNGWFLKIERKCGFSCDCNCKCTAIKRKICVTHGTEIPRKSTHGSGCKDTSQNCCFNRNNHKKFNEYLPGVVNFLSQNTNSSQKIAKRNLF